MNANLVVKVKEVVSEGKGMTTLRFDLDRTARPGQFVMVWVPGVDEVPMSLSYIGKTKGITVRADRGGHQGALRGEGRGDDRGPRPLRSGLLQA